MATHGFDHFTVKGRCWDSWRHLPEVCAFDGNGGTILISEFGCLPCACVEEHPRGKVLLRHVKVMGHQPDLTFKWFRKTDFLLFFNTEFISN